MMQAFQNTISVFPKEQETSHLFTETSYAFSLYAYCFSKLLFNVKVKEQQFQSFIFELSYTFDLENDFYLLSLCEEESLKCLMSYELISSSYSVFYQLNLKDLLKYLCFSLWFAKTFITLQFSKISLLSSEERSEIVPFWSCLCTFSIHHDLHRKCKFMKRLY